MKGKKENGKKEGKRSEEIKKARKIIPMQGGEGQQEK
jgi:hypothetical protein